MPVNAHTHQPFGVLHGGASVALAETAGSLASMLCIDAEKFMCLGQEINANHLRGSRGGTVTATARPYHLGARSHVWQSRSATSASGWCASRASPWRSSSAAPQDNARYAMSDPMPSMSAAAPARR